MSKIISIDTEVLGGGDEAAILAFARNVLQAVTDAYASDEVAYLVSNDEVVAAISPAVAAERYEHANAVMTQPRQHEEAVPVPARTRPRRRRRLGWSPFEGIF